MSSGIKFYSNLEPVDDVTSRIYVIDHTDPEYYTIIVPDNFMCLLTPKTVPGTWFYGFLNKLVRR